MGAAVKVCGGIAERKVGEESVLLEVGGAVGTDGLRSVCRY